MRDYLDLDRYPLDREGSAGWAELCATATAALEAEGMFDLENLLLPGVAETIAAEIAPIARTQSFEHRRRHNIYFRPNVPELPADHPALREVETVGHTVCADQIPHSIVMAIYNYPPLLRFLAATMGKSALHTMRDPLARVNVMTYRDGEALNWHFDRSEFTVTLLLQAPSGGGDFHYRSNLRTETDPNYEGVARLLNGEDPELRSKQLVPGTLNVFRGKNTPHRVTPVEGARDRMIAVFSYYEKPDVMFSDEERIGFYGRAA
ncbi:HalD/BesD family halogenase [Acidisoma silvae]|uniref:Fe2OG dioxygenase domain-containing protein n=1 Tax=Acidisoma silvae TaxID=2802396 RepID=A0A963YP42_9PROT|nr:hypothetical protein [Acidisoma silvae]MCB8874435.1 hypothetical protein [Acidisoma silvae]